MKLMQRLAAVAALAVACGSPSAQGLSPDEQAVIQRAAVQFLAGLDRNANYDVTAEHVMDRITMDMDDYVIIDVRMPREKKYDVGHLPGARFVAIHDLANPEVLAMLPRDKDVIVHCDTGQQQNKAVAVLRMLGYRAFGMRHGFLSWSPAPPTGRTLETIALSSSRSYPVEK